MQRKLSLEICLKICIIRVQLSFAQSCKKHRQQGALKSPLNAA